MSEKISKTDQEWREELSPTEFKVTRKHGTEPPYDNAYHDTKDAGTYRCRCCGEPLFSSDAKYDSGTGWPSFYQPLDEAPIGTETDRKLFMARTEVHCERCDAHLGHVFEDGPQPTGLRYCMNSASLQFEPREE